MFDFYKQAFITEELCASGLFCHNDQYFLYRLDIPKEITYVCISSWDISDSNNV